MFPSPIRARDVIGLELQGPAKAGLGLIQPTLELEDLSQPLMSLGRARGLSHELEQLVPGLFQVLPVDGGLGPLADLLCPGRLLVCGRLLGSRPAHTIPAASGNCRKQDQGKAPERDGGPAPHGDLFPSLGWAGRFRSTPLLSSAHSAA